MAYIQDIQFYVDDTEGRFSPSEYAQAYDIASSTYNDEKNRCLSAAIMLLNKEVIRLASEYDVIKDENGVEGNTFQTLDSIISSRKMLINSLQSQIGGEKNLYGSRGMRARRTVIRGVND